VRVEIGDVVAEGKGILVAPNTAWVSSDQCDGSIDSTVACDLDEPTIGAIIDVIRSRVVRRHNIPHEKRNMSAHVLPLPPFKNRMSKVTMGMLGRFV
jgi:hypothetical protein